MTLNIHQSYPIIEGLKLNMKSTLLNFALVFFSDKECYRDLEMDFVGEELDNPLLFGLNRYEIFYQRIIGAIGQLVCKLIEVRNELRNKAFLKMRTKEKKEHFNRRIRKPILERFIKPSFYNFLHHGNTVEHILCLTIFSVDTEHWIRFPARL